MSTQYKMTDEQIREVVDNNTAQNTSCVGWIIGFVIMTLAFFIVLGFLIYKIVKCKQTNTLIPPISKLTTTKTPSLLTKI